MKRPGAVRTALVLLVLLVLAFAAGWIWWLTRAPAPGPMALSAVSFTDLPGWSASDPRDALSAFRRSCEAIVALPPDHAMGGQGYAGTVGDWLGSCRDLPARASAQDARRWFEDHFSPFAVRAGWVSEGLFTGYYEPQISGSESRHGRYQTPVYAEPDDLVDVDLGRFRDTLRGERIAGRVVGHALVPYPTRAEIDKDGLAAARILFYSDDPVAVFFLHIQGSGRVRLDDGRWLRVAYAGQNGQPYTPIGRALIDEGQLAREHVSLQAIKDWMARHPDQARRVMEIDKSFVFFKEAPLGDPELGSEGAEGVPLTPGASLAVDPRIHAFGVPVFVTATMPADDPSEPERPFDRLLVAQDMGGAIRGPVRGDVYWGYGGRAESVAGRMKSRGQLYVLLPKAVASRVAGAQT